jgi:hypothetical protein
MINKNKEEVAVYSKEVAATLVRYRIEGNKTDRKNLLDKKIFGRPNYQSFLSALIEIIQDNKVSESVAVKINSLKDFTYLMNEQEFQCFWLVLKFDYYVLEKKS